MQFSAALLCRLFLQILKEELDYSGTLNLFLNNKERSYTLSDLSYHAT